MKEISKLRWKIRGIIVLTVVCSFTAGFFSRKQFVYQPEVCNHPRPIVSADKMWGNGMDTTWIIVDSLPVNIYWGSQYFKIESRKRK